MNLEVIDILKFIKFAYCKEREYFTLGKSYKVFEKGNY